MCSPAASRMDVAVKTEPPESASCPPTVDVANEEEEDARSLEAAVET